jgi:N-acetylmuramoyl-L-alanine amidase
VTRGIAIAMGLLAAVLLGAIAPVAAAQRDLSGAVIALDPGHQRGNSNPAFSSKVNATRFNGSIVKACNTTGTATNRGFPESTFNWKVTQRLASMLRERGAKVVLTRDGETYDAWGPCAWDRAKPANAVKANLFVSIHADGAPARAKGFHVIAPTSIPGYTDDIVSASRVLARSMIDGMKAAGATPSTYVKGALSVRGDQSTLNFSDVPSVIVELGNMRNASEAKAMSSRSGQQRYAEQLLAGISRYCAAPSRCR